MTRRLRDAAFALVLFAASAAAGAQSVPWTPSPSARHSIELLVDDAGLQLTTTQWPLPRDAVARALDRLPRSLEPRLQAARERVERELGRQNGSALTLTLRNSADALPGFGDDATPGSSVALRSSVLNGQRIALQLGGRIEANADPARSNAQFRLDDTALVTEALGVQLQAFAHKSWWSPGWQSALALGNNAPALTGIGLQRASALPSENRWLHWLGPWNFDVFAAQDEGITEPANPFVIGARFTFRPFSSLEIGLTRTAQWGGRGRDMSAQSALRLLTGIGSNADTVAEQPKDPGNEMAGFDLRARCPAGMPCAAYLQLIGEDEAGFRPSRYLGLYGFEWAGADGSGRYLAEYTETGCRSPIGRPFLRGCAYRNYAYPQGYTSAGRWLGSVFGPDSRVLTLGWLDADTGTSLRLHVGRIGSRSGAYTPLLDDPQHAGHLTALSAQRSLAWGDAVVTPELDWQRVHGVDGTHQTLRVGVSARMPFDDAFATGRTRLGASLSGIDGSAWTPALVAAGLIGGAALLDRPADRYATAHGNNPSASALRHTGNWLPVAGIGLAGLSWLTQRDSPAGELGGVALQSGAGATAVALLAKFAVDRSRPSDERGPSRFGEAQRSKSSFPSLHTTLAWALVTPYAQHYDLPWLYGVAALTNASRVMGRDHWLSDTVAGAALGHWVGSQFYRRSHAAGDAPSRGSLSLTPGGVNFSMKFD